MDVAASAAAPLPDWRAVLDRRGRWSALVTSGSSPAVVARHCTGLAFLAAPWLDPDRRRKDWRAEWSVRMSLMAAREAVRLHGAGVAALCPTLQMAEMCHAAVTLPEARPDPMDMSGWAAWSGRYLSAACLLVVPEIEGWSRCPLIRQQLAWALLRNMPVHVYAGAAP